MGNHVHQVWRGRLFHIVNKQENTRKRSRVRDDYSNPTWVWMRAGGIYPKEYRTLIFYLAGFAKKMTITTGPNPWPNR